MALFERCISCDARFLDDVCQRCDVITGLLAKYHEEMEIAQVEGRDQRYFKMKPLSGERIPLWKREEMKREESNNEA